MSIKISDSLIPILLILSKALIKEKLSYLSAHNSMKFAWNESHPLMEASGRDLYHVRASPSRFDTNILITTSSCSTLKIIQQLWKRNQVILNWFSQPPYKQR